MDLSDAIAERRVVTFTYDGHSRVVHPAALGPHVSTGRLSLRGYQVGGTSRSRSVPLWDLFTVAKIDGLVVTAEEFVANPPGYSRGDKHLRVITELN
jgi:hypothetical protein